jgi:2-oxoglutarate ferredoxin oxidoreductase subunit gamma
LVVDSGMVDQLPDHPVYGFPFAQLARDKVGTPMVANIIALGAIVSLTKVASKKGFLEVVKRRAPKGTEDRNLKAAQIGLGLIHKKAARKEKKVESTSVLEDE